MLERIFTCDYCGEKINYQDKEDDYVSLDGYWAHSDSYIDEMHFHKHCWDEIYHKIIKRAK